MPPVNIEQLIVGNFGGIVSDFNGFAIFRFLRGDQLVGWVGLRTRQADAPMVLPSGDKEATAMGGSFATDRK